MTLKKGRAFSSRCHAVPRCSPKSSQQECSYTCKHPHTQTHPHFYFSILHKNGGEFIKHYHRLCETMTSHTGFDKLGQKMLSHAHPFPHSPLPLPPEAMCSYFSHLNCELVFTTDLETLTGENERRKSTRKLRQNEKKIVHEFSTTQPIKKRLGKAYTSTKRKLDGN